MYFTSENRHGIRLQAMRRRFWQARKAAGVAFQLRDLRAKAATDSTDSRQAQALLGHASASTTDTYIRRTAGQVASPVLRTTRRIADKAGSEAK